MANHAHQLVTLHHDRAITTSNVIASHFGKRHDNVINAIRQTINLCPAEFNHLNFKEVEFLDGKGEMRPAYELTRDAFMLVAMSFSEERALQFKIAYIDAFNRMEAALHQQGQTRIFASLDAVHAQEEIMRAQIGNLKDELLDTLRTQVKLLGKTRKVTGKNKPILQSDIAQIRSLAAAGMSTSAIAGKMGRSCTTVHYALRGADVPVPADGQAALFTVEA
jgi:Rha family phage regulatory protein